MKRTIPQNNAGHKWFRQIAEALNDAGYTVNSREVLQLDVPFTEDVVKEFMFKRVMSAMFPDKTSTTQLTTAQFSEVAKVVERHLAASMGVNVPFPCEDGDG